MNLFNATSLDGLVNATIMRSLKILGAVREYPISTNPFSPKPYLIGLFGMKTKSLEPTGKNNTISCYVACFEINDKATWTGTVFELLLESPLMFLDQMQKTHAA